MIPVAPAPEPASFDAKVRTPGKAWLVKKGLSGANEVPKGMKISAVWTECLPEMLDAYDRICAYASLKIHAVTGASSVDHFAPKSRGLADAYEWDNYRLACAKLNARKNNFDDVLDPFTMAADTFRLNTLDGSIHPNPALPAGDLAAAQATMARLKLDDAEMRKARLNLINLYLAKEISSGFLKSESPFIWVELERQGVQPL
jgi:uncharacterized protein (TIGR02646 family)